MEPVSYLVIMEDGSIVAYDDLNEDDFRSCEEGLCDLLMIMKSEALQWDPEEEEWVTLNPKCREDLDAE